MEIQCARLTLVAAIVVLLPFGVFLEFRRRQLLSESRNRAGNLQLLWETVRRLNEKLIEVAKERNIEVKQASEYRDCRDLGESKGRFHKSKPWDKPWDKYESDQLDRKE